MPNYVCGKNKLKSNTNLNGKHPHEENEIIILEDLSLQGYKLVDPELMMFNLEEMKVIIILLTFKKILNTY